MRLKILYTYLLINKMILYVINEKNVFLKCAKRVFEKSFEYSMVYI